MQVPLWVTEFGGGPIVSCAIHDGHHVRAELLERIRLGAGERRYEEDPHTAAWTRFAPTRIIGCRSRFEFDLNRPREKAVYLAAEDAWGLDIWKSPPDTPLVERLLADHDTFYAHLHDLIERLLTHHSHLVVFDLHSYNHLRDGVGGPCADPDLNPDINLGTGSMDREYWGPVADRFLAEVRGGDYFGRKLDVRENVRFQGGYMVQWIHANFPRRVCGLAVEVKKFFMNEWSGEVHEAELAAIGEILARSAAGVSEELENYRDDRRAS